MPLKDDIRTFHECFPDPVYRHKVHYSFAHRFVPGNVFKNPYAFFSYVYEERRGIEATDPTLFIQSRWTYSFMEMFGITPPERIQGFLKIAELKMSLHSVAGHPATLITMPAPERPSEAHYLCVVLSATGLPASWAPKVTARVFTLEASGSDVANSGMIGEWNDTGTHFNHGIKIKPEMDRFMSIVSSLISSHTHHEPAAISQFAQPDNPDSKTTITLREPGPSAVRYSEANSEKKPWWKMW